MKNIFLLILSGLFISACNNVAVISPTDALSDQTIFNDSTNIELAMTGVYNSLQSQQFGYNKNDDPRGYPFGAAHIEQGEMRGEDLVNTQGFYGAVYLNTQTSSSPNVVNLWSSLFELINQANVMADGLATTKAISSKRANMFIGECRFLRAISYFDLCVFFCRPYLDAPTTNMGVPYHLTGTNPTKISAGISLPRGTVADDYKQIIADLTFASQNLPVTRDDNSVTRATKGAALGFLSRVYLHMGDLANVKASADALIALGTYSIAATVDGAFTNNSSTESIFSVEWSKQDGASVNGGLGGAFLPAQPSGGRGLIGVSPTIFNAKFFAVDDARRSKFLIQSTDPNNTTYYINKYKDPVTFSDWAPLIRYEEVLLNDAEAYARSGDVVNGLRLLNQVRNRAVAASEVYTVNQFATANDLVQAILNERRIELVGEGFRWPDISRLSKDPNPAFRPVVSSGVYGIPPKLFFSNYTGKTYLAGSGNVVANPSVAGVPYSSGLFIYPISNTEIANNPNMVQNPGY